MFEPPSAPAPRPSQRGAFYRAPLGLGIFLALAVFSPASQARAASPWPSEAARAIENLNGSDRARKVAAVRALSGVSPALARPGVEQALGDDEAAVRHAAAYVALANGYLGLAPIVETWLSSHSVVDRLLGVRLLAKDADEARIRVIASLLSDPERQVRALVVEVLGGSSRRDAALASNLLLSGLDDPEPRVRALVAHALGRLGNVGSALPLAGHINDPEPEVREEIARALGALGDQSVAPALVASLGDPEDRVIVAAVRSLSYLGFEPAVFSLLALLERPSVDEVVREAIFALATLGSVAALEGLMKKVHDPRYQVHLLPALMGLAPRRVPGLESCLRETAGDVLMGCVRIWVGLGGAAEPVLQAVSANRMTLSKALGVLTDHPSFDATVLALEALRGTDSASSDAARLYLRSQDSLPKQAGAALSQALEYSQNDPERALLLELLSRVQETTSGDLALEHLRSKHEDVARAAAELLVATGAAGEDLSRLLTSERASWAEGAALALARRTTQAQADTLVALLAQGQSGRSGLLLDLLWALPDGLSLQSERQLLALLSTADDGADRDALFEGLAHGSIQTLVSLLPDLGRDDRLKVAQLGWIHPQGALLAEALLDDSDHRVSALAVQQFGLVGQPEKVVAAYRRLQKRKGSPHYLTATALRSLAAAAMRQQKLSLPAEALSAENCSSPHLGTFLAAQLLAYGSGKSCHDHSLVDLLLNDERARVRLSIAQMLLRFGRLSPELLGAVRRCSIYETRHEIAALCRRALTPASAARPLEPASDGPALMRFRLRPTWLPGEIFLYPAVIELTRPGRDDTTLMIVSDRRGLVLLPQGSVTLEDAALAF